MSPKSSQIGKENARQVEKRIKERLKAATRNTDPRRAFICTEDVKQIWNSLDDIELILSGTSEWSREELETIQKDYVLTLSILLLINWLGEHDFKTTFFSIGADENKRNDETLHYTESDLEFLGRYQDNFFEKQFLFKPAVLKGSDNQLVDGSLRLPFTEDSQPLGSGGFGYVNKVIVAPGHFETEHRNVNKIVSTTLLLDGDVRHINIYPRSLFSQSRGFPQPIKARQNLSSKSTTFNCSKKASHDRNVSCCILPLLSMATNSRF